MSAAIVVVGQNSYDRALTLGLEITPVIGEGVSKDLIVACRRPAEAQDAILLQPYEGSNRANDDKS